MKTRYAFLFAILITGLIASNVYIFNHIFNSSPLEEVFISRIIDGDTLVLADNRTIRLANINAPEKDSPLSEKATAFLKSFENSSVNIEFLGLDKYGRYLARIYAPSYLNLELVSQGLASKFLVEEDELKKFSKAEQQAIDSNKGIWKKSDYFGCFSSEIKEKDEIVILKNNCKNIGMINWQLKDESRKIYNFKNISFSMIVIHSSEGDDNSTDIFWDYGSDIWNNDRDSLYLFDNQGRLAHYESYGY